MQRLICAGRHRSLESYALVLLLSAGLVIGCASAEAVSSDSVARHQLDVSNTKLSGILPSKVPAGTYVFNNRQQWEEFLTRHSWLSQIEKPRTRFNFRDFTLVAVFLGQKPNPGYSVRIAGAKEQGGETVVEVVEYLPSPGMMYAQVIVYPYDAALIPKAAGQVRFETTKKIGRP